MVLYITMNGKSGISHTREAFAQMYRRANGTFYEAIKIDGLVRSQKKLFSVIPAQAGIQSFQDLLDSRLRGSDDLRDFSRTHQDWKGCFKAKKTNLKTLERHYVSKVVGAIGNVSTERYERLLRKLSSYLLERVDKFSSK